MENSVETQTFEQKVTSIVNEASLDDNGNLVLPKDMELDEATKYAVTAEKRRRDTQSAYSRAQQQIRQLTAAQEAAYEELENTVSVDLTDDERVELEELKTVNPEAWRQKLNSYDVKKKDKVNSIKTKITEKTSRETALEERKRLLTAHNEANPDFALTDEVIENDIPPRFLKKLEKGEVTFEQFIADCSAFLQKGKKVQSPEEPITEIDLSEASGSSKIPASALKASSSGDYKKETY